MIRKFLAIVLSIFSLGVKAAQPYTLFASISAEKLDCWASHYLDFTEIVGYSSLGHFILKNPNSNEYIVLHPFKQAAKSYGTFSSLAEFETSVLNEPGFAEYVLRPQHVAAIRERIGPLKEDEIYIPQPYPFLGGSEAPNTYEKGNVWVFIDIVGQMAGVCE